MALGYIVMITSHYLAKEPSHNPSQKGINKMVQEGDSEIECIEKTA